MYSSSEPLPWRMSLATTATRASRFSDVMIECGDEQALLVLGPLARGDVESEALEAYKAPHGVEFGLCCFLEPDFPAVGVLEAEGDGIGRGFGVDAAHERLEPLAVVRMHPREKVARGKGLPRVEPQDLRGVGAALRRTRADVPYERRDRPCRQRLLQAGFALRERGFVLPPLGEQRGENVCAERDSQDAGASGKHAVRHRETRIAEATDSDRRRPDDCEGDDEGRRRSEDRPAACRNPQQDRKQQRDRHDRRPRLRRQCNDDDAHDDERRQRDETFDGFAPRRRLARCRGEPDHQRRDRDDAERVGCEPVLPGVEDRCRRAMEQGEPEGPADPGDGGCDDRCPHAGPARGAAGQD